MRNELTLTLLVLATFFRGAQAAPVTTITANGLGTIVTPGSNGFFNVTGGKTVSGSVYHSFANFNLGTGSTADFNVASTTSVILARVTGGASSIDGTITSTLGAATFNSSGNISNVSNASLIFINPAGILFTANSQVNLGGTFVASTANYAQCSDGTIFYADLNHPTNDAGLTASPVTSFGFLNATPQPISFIGAQLTGAGGTGTNGLDFIGGNITVDQDSTTGKPSILKTDGHSLSIFSAASTGQVPFSLTAYGTGYVNATTTSFGTILIQNNSKVYATSTIAPGKIIIRGGRMVLDDSTLTSSDTGTTTGANISVEAVTLNVQNGAQIITTGNESGNGGNVTITANTLTVDGTNPSGSTTSVAGATGIFATDTFPDTTYTGTYGHAGAVTCTVADQLTLENGGDISGGTLSSANGGNVTVTAGSLSLNGVGTEISASAASLNGNPGNAGSVSVTTTTGPLSITDGAQIVTDAVATNGTRTAVNISVTDASTLTIDGTNSTAGSTGIFLSSTGIAAPPGLLTLNVTGATNLLGGGEIESSTGVTGTAGKVSLTTSALSLTGSSSIFTETTGSGIGAMLQVNVTNALAIANGSELLTTSSGTGANGALSVNAGSASIDGASFQYGTTGIISESIDPANTAAAAALTVDVTGTLSANDGGEISAATLASGNDNPITLTAGTASVNGTTVATSTLQDGVFANPLSNLYPALTFDGSLGSGGASAFTFGPIYQIPLTTATGEQVGDNFFLSFGLFNLSQGDAATFMGGTGVQNIIARVTQGSSTNDGVIASTIPGANIFLLDQDGVAFGPHAGINTTGSFAVSTANALKFDDGGTGIFNAQTGAGDVLSGSPVDGFDFSTGSPQPISFTNSQIEMQPGTDLTVISGNVTLNGAELLTPSGEISIFSAASPGEVPFNAATPWSGYATAQFSALGNITLENEAWIALDGSNGGNLGIRGGNIVVDNSQITSANSGTGSGGNLDVMAESLTLQNSTAAQNATTDANNAEITASTTAAAGAAGNLTVNVGGELSILDGASISSITSGSGNAGNISVTSGSLDIDGVNFVGDRQKARRSQIESVSTSLLSTTTVTTYGASGSLTVNTGTLTVADGAQISTDTVDNGAAGQTDVTANTITVTGVANNDPVDLPNNVMTASSINSNTFGSGAAGSTVVTAATVNLTNSGIINSSSGSSGAAGPIILNAGNLNITGEQVQLTPPGSNRIIQYPSEIVSTTSSSGNPGAITINVTGSVSLSDGGLITSSSGGSKPAGTVNLNAGSVTIDGEYLNPVIKPAPSGILSTAISTNGGTITVVAGSVTLSHDGIISALSQDANAGNIIINAGTVSLVSGAEIETTAAIGGGNIDLIASDYVYMHDSLITSASGGDGGNITIDPDLVVLNDGLISASGGIDGGRISIVTDEFLSNNMIMTATGGVSNGAISISAPDLNLAASLVPLPSSLESEEKRLRESCARSVNHEFSSFTVVGRGGTESAPEELQPDFGFDILPGQIR